MLKKYASILTLIYRKLDDLYTRLEKLIISTIK